MGVPAIVQVTLKVAVLVKIAVGMAAATTVQVPPLAAGGLPLQPSDVIVKSPKWVPPKIGAEQLVAEVGPELVKVKIAEREGLPTFAEANVLDILSQLK